MDNETLVIAHRGASGHCPENTMIAFRRAVNVGAEMLEIDVQRTADNQLAVIHDFSVDRTTNGHGPVAELTMAHIKELDAGAWFSRDYAGEKVPSLPEVLALARTMNIRLCIEIKADEEVESQRTALLTADCIAAAKAEKLAGIYTHCAVPKALKESHPTIVLGYDGDWQSGKIDAWDLCAHAVAAGANWLAHPVEGIAAGLVKEAHFHGLAVWVWTVDEPEVMRELMAMNVDGIMSNLPALLYKTVHGA